MKESRTRRQIIVSGIDDLQTGRVFTTWPLHITVLPWFRGIKNQKKLHATLDTLTEQQRPIIANIGNVAMFDTGDVPVSLVEPADEIRELHLAVMDALNGLGSVLEDLSHVGYKYNPYIASSDPEKLATTYQIESLALISVTPASYKQVDRVFDFHG